MIDNRNLFTCAEISVSDLSSVESKLGGKAHYFQDHSGKKKIMIFVLVNSLFGILFVWKMSKTYFLLYNVGLSYFC